MVLASPSNPTGAVQEEATLRELASWPVWALYTDYGAPAFGGGISTDSGLYFIGAAMDDVGHAC